MPQGAAKQAFSRKEARRLLGIGEAQLRSWEKQGLVPSLQTFAFSDLLALRTLQKLRRGRLSAARIRSILAALRQKVSHIRNPLKELKIVAEGRRVAVVIEGHLMEPLSGQLLLEFDREQFARLVAFPPSGAGRRAAAQAREAEVWFQRGLDLEQTGAPFEKVVEAYESAVALDPNSAGAMVNLGTVYYHRRDWKQAEHWYMKALEADPAYALAHFNLGNLFDERGERSQAMAHYARAIRLNPRYADAHYNLALLYQSCGAAMQAVHHWQQYLKLDPNSSWAAIARRELEKLRQATVLPGSRPRGPNRGAGNEG